MNAESVDRPAGVSRRDLLKKGAVVGAAAAWTIPMVQVVSMTAAHADSPSAPTPPPPGNPTPVPSATTTTTTSSAGSLPTKSESAHAVSHGAASPASTTSVAATSSLPFTGSEIKPALGLGAAAVAIGVGAVAAASQIGRRNGTEGAPSEAE